jgi:hypothetical protein
MSDNKTVIIRFRNDGWHKIICKDFKIIKNDKGILRDIKWTECEGHNIPYYLDVNEIVAIIPDKI